jgi:hypothetical protein
MAPQEPVRFEPRNQERPAARARESLARRVALAAAIAFSALVPARREFWPAALVAWLLFGTLALAHGARRLPDPRGQ